MSKQVDKAKKSKWQKAVRKLRKGSSKRSKSEPQRGGSFHIGADMSELDLDIVSGALVLAIAAAILLYEGPRAGEIVRVMAGDVTLAKPPPDAP